MEEIQKQELTSMDIKEAQLQKLKELFPEAFTEGMKVDWDKLRLTLGDEPVDTGKERYGMNWPGKANCFKTIQQPSIATLIPVRDESIDFDTTQNLFIEGDNLEVLKLLQKSYLGKIKMIYIDPPYNTGNDFIYPDNYSENLDTYLEYTGQIDGEGRKFATNTEMDGRFHSKWMNMIYPRLFLAKNLLKEDGVIFISIDDKEVSNLKALCNEIFGEENILAQFMWRTDGNFDNQAKVKKCHEYILAFCKNINAFPAPPSVDPSINSNSKIFKGEIRNTIVKNGQANPISTILLPIGFPVEFEKGILEKRNNSWPHYLNDAQVSDFKLQNETLIESGWSSRDLVLEFIANKMEPIVDGKGQETTFLISKAGALEVIKKRGENQSHVISVITNVGNTQTTSANLKKDEIYFDYPKPVQLLKYLISMNSGNEFIALDFFGGSGTLAQAVMELNKERKESFSRIKFILVQLPEPCDSNSTAFKSGCLTIADVAKKRIKLYIEKYDKEVKLTSELFDTSTQTQDLGFKVYKLAQSNFKVWDTTLEKSPEAIQRKLFEHIQHISPEAQQEAILYELLLKSGFELTTIIETLTLAGKTVFGIAEGQLLICLEKEITHDCIKAMAEKEPSRVICLDEAFTGTNADALKTNAVQIMKSKGVVNFRTV